MSEKLCACGCGIPVRTEAMSFRQGHWAKVNRSAISGWKRKGVLEHTRGGYLSEFSRNGDRRLQHILIAEKAIGKPLPDGAQIHHVNEVKSDNRPENLVVCPDRSYHALLHVRTDAYNATGDANKRKCVFCKQWDSPERLYIPVNGGSIEHRACGKKYRDKRLRERKFTEQERVVYG